jgi:hypothetical protein
MLRAIGAISALKTDDILYVLVRSALYPLILIAEALRRATARTKENAYESATRPLFVETREQASITASYVLMARATLQSFGRRPRTERSS